MFEKPQHVIEKNDLPLQQDPILIRMNTGSSARRIYPFNIGLAAFVSIIYLMLIFSHPSNNARNADIANEFIWLFNCCIQTFNYYVQTIAFRYWQKKLLQRPYALMHSEQLLAANQPQAVPAYAGIMELSFRVKKIWTALVIVPLFIALFSYLAVIMFDIKQFISLSEVGAIIVLTLMAILFIAIFFFIRNVQNRLIVAYNGIASIQNKIQDAIDWQDARLFSTYTGPRSLFDRSPARYYELASDKAIVRWQWQTKHFNRFTFTPAMSQQEYDTWMQQVLNQVVTYTGLPLVDLDKLDNNEVQVNVE